MSGGGRLQTALSALLEKGDAAPGEALGVRSAGAWTGPPVLDVGSNRYRVRACRSTLAVRRELAEPRDAAEGLVLLWPHAEAALPDDVRARLAGGKLQELHPWHLAVKALDLTSVDPSLHGPGRDGWLPQFLLDAIDATHPPRPPNGHLTGDLGWGLLLGAMLGLPADARQDLPGLLLALEDDATRARWRALQDAERAGICERVAAVSGAGAHAALGPWSLAEGAPTPLAAGLVLDGLRDGVPTDDREALRRWVRLEDRLGLGEGGPEAAAPWADAAVAAVERLDVRARRKPLARADTLAAESAIGAACRRSVWLPVGWNARVGAFADALALALQGPADGPSRQLLALEAELGQHRLSEEDEARRTRDRVRASLSLLRWLGLPEDTTAAPPPFPEAARAFAHGGSHADDARRRTTGGHAHPALDAAVRDLLAAVGKKRERENERFAASLASWLEAAPATRHMPREHGLVPADRFLGEVLAPLAEKRPLLLIVADGLPLDIARRLTAGDDLDRWRERCFAGEPRRLLGVAPLPTVTRLARTTLLTGRRAQGNADNEREGFATHAGLLAACGRRAAPPLLLHKKGYFRGDGSGLTDTCREAVKDPARQVVAVVINAVDEALGGGDRVERPWDADDLPGLLNLFALADEAQRLVVLVSDHGHVSERGTEARVADRVAEGGGGERWRPGRDAAGDAVEPGPGERLFRGPGVGFPGEEAVGVVAPWTESLRYTRGANDGYHGGATPQEVITPILLLDASPEETPGLEDLPEDKPLWAIDPSLDAAGPGLDATPPAERGPAVVLPAPEPAPAGGLFEPEPEPTPEPAAASTGPRWIATLLASDVYASQRETVKRVKFEKEEVAAWLEAFDDLGHQVTIPAIASRLKLSLMRAKGEVAILQRLLNVDGYEVLTLEGASQTLKLNPDLLLTQFDLPDAR